VSRRTATPFGGIVRLCLLTAQRKQKVAAMRHDDIVDDVWRIPQAPREKDAGGDLVLPKLALNVIGTKKAYARRMAKDNKETSNTSTVIPPLRGGMLPKHDRQFSATNQPAKNPGRPPGSLNKITRTMKDAAVAAAEELGPRRSRAHEDHVGLQFHQLFREHLHPLDVASAGPTNVHSHIAAVNPTQLSKPINEPG